MVRPPIWLLRNRVVFIALVAILCALVFDAFNNAEATSMIAEQTWLEWGYSWSPWGVPPEDIAKKAREEFAKKFSGPLVLMAVVAVVLTVFGPPYFERGRSWVALKLRLDHRTQRELLIAGFSVGIASTNLAAWISETFQFVRLPVAILSCGATFVFLVEALPALSESDASRRKAAFAALKSFVFLAAVLFVFASLIMGGMAGVQVSASSG